MRRQAQPGRDDILPLVWRGTRNRQARFSYFMAMSTVDKVVMILCIFGGFLWLRARARAVHAERRQGMALVGLFMVLPALLIAESRVFERLSYGPATNALLKAAILVATFAAVGYGFLRPVQAGSAEGGPPDPGAAGGAS